MEISESEVFMVLSKVAAIKAHVAPHGSKSDAFKEVPDALIGNIDFSPSVDTKSVRNRYERLQQNLDAEAHQDFMTSGVCG